MDALIIIDMQKASFIAKRHKTREVINNIKSLAEYFRSQNVPVLHIRHEDESYKKGSRGWDFVDDLQPQNANEIITKACCDAFIDTTLDQVLQKLNVTRLIITGCATDFCVDGTIKGAIVKGYDVVVASDAHTTGDRPQIDAATLADFFNWNWPLQLTGSQSLTVLSTIDIMG